MGEHERKTLKPLDLKTVVYCNLYTYRYFILSSDGDENIKETCGRIYAEHEEDFLPFLTDAKTGDSFTLGYCNILFSNPSPPLVYMKNS